MAIQQTKKQSDLEKRLQLLRKQVYGKESLSQKSSYSFRSSHEATSDSITSDITYLRQDLLKILIFSTIAIGIQLILFFLLKKDALTIKFF